jgi:hypothetical protein
MKAQFRPEDLVGQYAIKGGFDSFLQVSSEGGQGKEESRREWRAEGLLSVSIQE